VDLIVTDHKSYRVDASAWPMVVNRTLAKELSNEQLSAALGAMDRLLNSRKDRFSIVHDYRGFGRFDAVQRKMVIEYGRINTLRTLARCAGIAFVMDSAVLRGLLTAVHWLQPPKTRTKVFADVNAAMRWALALHKPSTLSETEGGESIRPPPASTSE